jgi:hypothetical protein
MKTLITIAILSLVLVGSAHAQVQIFCTDSAGDRDCINHATGEHTRCSGGFCRSSSGATSQCTTGDADSYSCNNSDGSYTHCLRTGDYLTCTTNDTNARRNADELAGYAAAGAGLGALAGVLVDRHQAQKWGKRYCALSPELESWEYGRFHGKCKQAKVPR